MEDGVNQGFRIQFNRMLKKSPPVGEEAQITDDFVIPAKAGIRGFFELVDI
jgi:hypothetical protein